MLHLVESDPENLSGLRRFIISSGFDLLAFDSSLLYLEYAKSPEFAPPVALLTSYHMPLMNGAELATEIQKLHPEQKIVLISDFPEPSIAAQTGHSICSYLHQPNYFAKLATLLRVLYKCGRDAEKINTGIFRDVCQIERNRSCPHHPCQKEAPLSA